MLQRSVAARCRLVGSWCRWTAGLSSGIAQQRIAVAGVRALSTAPVDEQWTDFGQRFTADSGINRLMDDLADATRPGAPPVLMMGGGNPAQIPEVKEALRDTMIKMLQDEPGEQSAPLLHAVSNYDGPPGGKGLVEAVAEHFSEHYGWDISAENVALTNGSQSSFFYLFNALAGEQAGVGRKQVLFPLCPEYLGYAEVGLSDDMFTSVRPSINIDEEAKLYKYSIDFERLEAEVDWSKIGVVCVSRPTNPTGNVLTDDEVERLDLLAKKHGVPLLIDNAYGTPFPSIIHVPATPVWNDNIILCLSLSKLGLPGVRTGICIARPGLIKAIANCNGILTLAPNSLGPAIGAQLLQEGTIQQLSAEVVRPFYKERATVAMKILQEELETAMGPKHRVLVHKPEGCIFLWVWFRDLPIRAEELYFKLKEKGVLIIPGHLFFPGQESTDWTHKHECIRMSYGSLTDDETLRKGIRLIATEAADAYANV